MVFVYECETLIQTYIGQGSKRVRMFKKEKGKKNKKREEKKTNANYMELFDNASFFLFAYASVCLCLSVSSIQNIVGICGYVDVRDLFRISYVFVRYV